MLLLQPRPSDKEYVDESGAERNRFLLELFYLRLFCLLHVIGNLFPEKIRHAVYDNVIPRAVSLVSTYVESDDEDKPDFLRDIVERWSAYEKALQDTKAKTPLWPLGEAFAGFCEMPEEVHVGLIGVALWADFCDEDTKAIKEILKKNEVVQ